MKWGIESADWPYKVLMVLVVVAGLLILLGIVTHVYDQIDCSQRGGNFRPVSAYWNRYGQQYNFGCDKPTGLYPVVRPALFK